MRVIANLKAEGVSVIFISHRLNELSECADRVVVLRDGRMVGELAKHEITHAAMIRLMIGRDLKSLYLPPAAPPGAAVLEILEARTSAYPDHAVSLAVRGGEILGLAGLVGAGRTELARAIFWHRPAARRFDTARRTRDVVRIARRRHCRGRLSWSPRIASAAGCCSTCRLPTTSRSPTLQPMQKRA